jgi:acetolactate synthase-1/2/3 large subunit
VVCFAGDGAFMYHLTELETARRYGIPVIVVVNNNSCLAQGARAISEAYKNQPGNPGEIHNFRSTNFAAIAKSMDCNGIRVEHASEYGAAMQRALQSDIPTVIDVVTDPEVLAPLPWGPG